MYWAWPSSGDAMPIIMPMPFEACDSWCAMPLYRVLQDTATAAVQITSPPPSPGALQRSFRRWNEACGRLSTSVDEQVPDARGWFRVVAEVPQRRIVLVAGAAEAMSVCRFLVRMPERR